jgi:membrane protease YdiL (CAAX protease family)
MNMLIPWFHILLAILAYLLVALSTMLIVKKWGHELKNTAERTSTPVLLIGALANLVVLALVLIFMTTVDHFPITALGLKLSIQDGLFAQVAIASMILLAGLFVRRTRKGLKQTSSKLANLQPTLVGFLVLLTVAVQEEVLYRGYITLNLAAYSPLTIILASTIIFVLIHFLTNRIGKYQVISWIISGLLLSGVYLVSGSIWVPIVVHLVTDLVNVLFFDITRQQTAQDSSSAITAKDRATFRIIYGVIVFWMLFIFYFPLGQGSFSVQMNGADPRLGTQNVDSNLIGGKISISGVEVGPTYIRLKGQSTLPDETCILITLSEDGQPVPWWPTQKCAEPSTDGQWKFLVEFGKAGVPENLEDTLTYKAKAQAKVDPPIQSPPFVFNLTGPPAP